MIRVGSPAAGGPHGAEPVIRTRGLTKHYGDLVAVDHLDLEVHAGEIFGLLGPNGAGKTTTILMLLGLSEPTDGEARVVGLDPARNPLEVKRQVGYLPDAVGFYGNLSGRQNLRYTARLNGLPKDEAERRIDEVLEQVRLSDRADEQVDHYSRGMKQRLGIADALVKDPRILILDEPTTAIDPIGVREILDLIGELTRDRGIALLLSSHLLNQVQSVCDRVGVFYRGRLIGMGTVDSLAHEFGDGGGQLEIGVRIGSSEDEERVAAVLGGTPGIMSVAAVGPAGGAAEPGVLSWRISLDPGRDVRQAEREVVTAVMDLGLGLERFGRTRLSLEQIYRHAVERATGENMAGHEPTSAA
jgi:ABC-2 type transport system ATP-binding protein